LGGGERGGFVGVGIVDSDVEGLVTNLPEEGASCLEGIGLVFLSRAYNLNARITHS
jgi:hypothetical protein